MELSACVKLDATQQHKKPTTTAYIEALCQATPVRVELLVVFSNELD
jgi:hypothetical protein